jgi:hypothetical protein
MRPVEQDPSRLWMSHKYVGEHIAGRAADIDDGLEHRKVVGGRDRWRFASMKANHCSTKYGCGFGMVSQIIEERHTVCLLKARTTCLQRVKKIGEATTNPAASRH